MTGRQSDTPLASRRSFLAGAAGAAGLALLPTTGMANEQLSIRSRLSLRGTREAVLDDAGETVFVATRLGWATADVSDPANPEVLWSERGLMADHEDGPIAEVFDLSASGDRVVVGGPAQGFGDLKGIVTFDVSDPANPERLNFYETGYGVHNVFLDGDIAYVTANGRSGKPVDMIDISMDEPERVGEFSPADYGYYPGTIHDMYVSDGTLYACYWDLGTWVADVSDPTDPEALYQVGHDRDAETGTSRNELPGNSHYAQPHPERDILAVGKEAFEDENTAVDGAPGGIELWDVSDTSNPKRAYIIAPPEETADSALRTSHNFGWRGDRLYASWYTAGVAVYEVTDAAAPKLLGGWRDGTEADFWTAKPIHDGFLGASYGEPEPDEDEPDSKNGAGLFLFPEPSGDDAEPAPEMEALAPQSTMTDIKEPTPTPSPTPTDSPTATPSPTDSPTPTDVPSVTDAGDGTSTGTSSTSSPGFGALTTLAAGGLAGWRLLQRRRDEE